MFCVFLHSSPVIFDCTVWVLRFSRLFRCEGESSEVGPRCAHGRVGRGGSGSTTTPRDTTRGELRGRYATSHTQGECCLSVIGREMLFCVMTLQVNTIYFVPPLSSDYITKLCEWVSASHNSTDIQGRVLHQNLFPGLTTWSDTYGAGHMQEQSAMKPTNHVTEWKILYHRLHAWIGKQGKYLNCDQKRTYRIKLFLKSWLCAFIMSKDYMMKVHVLLGCKLTCQHFILCTMPLLKNTYQVAHNLITIITIVLSVFVLLLLLL